MPKQPIDDRSVNRLLNGEMTVETAPPGYARVAALLSAARPEPATQELPLEAATVMVMQGAISSGIPLAAPQKSSRLRKIVTAKTAAVAGVLMLTATGAAAATGSLPGAAQQFASDALSKVGISVPGPNSHAGEHPDSHGKSADHTNNGQSDDHTQTTGPNAHAQFGQCNAQAASAGHPNEHSAVANATGCTDVTHPGNANGAHDGGTKPESNGNGGTNNGGTNNGANGNHGSQSTDHGPPSSSPGHNGTPQGQGSGATDHGKTTDSTANDAGSSGTGTTGVHGRP